MIEQVIANSKARVSPLYQAYKARVEADGGTVYLTQAQMKQLFEPFKHGPHWVFIASGRKTGRLYTIFPNTAADDLVFSRASKAVAYNTAGKMAEIAEGLPAFDYNASAALLGFNASAQATNYLLNNASTDYSGSGGANLESPYAWPHTTLYTHAKYYPADNTTRRAFKTANIAAGTYCFSCYIKMDDLSAPVINSGNPALNDFQINMNSSSSSAFGAVYGLKLIRDNVYLVWATATLPAHNGFYGIQRTMPLQSGKGFRSIGFQLNAGIAPARDIITSGTIATKLFDDSETANELPMDNVVLYADVRNDIAMGSGTAPQGFSLRTGASSYISVGYTAAGLLGMAVVQAGAIMLQINGIAANGKVAARFKNGAFALAVNGVIYTQFVIGSQDYVNPFAESATVQLGHMNRNITIKQAAVLTAGTDNDLIQLTT